METGGYRRTRQGDFLLPGKDEVGRSKVLSSPREPNIELLSGAMRSIEPGISRFRVRCCASPRKEVLCLARADCSKPSSAPPHLFLGEENLPGVFYDILRFPSVMRRLPARFFHHPHLAHAAGSGNAEHLAGLV